MMGVGIGRLVIAWISGKILGSEVGLAQFMACYGRVKTQLRLWLLTDTCAEYLQHMDG